MEAEIETKKKFQPIEIKLVIESEEELCDLWHRLNITSCQLNKAYLKEDALKFELIDNMHYDAWNYLDEKVNELNLVL